MVRSSTTAVAAVKSSMMYQKACIVLAFSRPHTVSKTAPLYSFQRSYRRDASMSHCGNYHDEEISGWCLLDEDKCALYMHISRLGLGSKTVRRIYYQVTNFLVQVVKV